MNFTNLYFERLLKQEKVHDSQRKKCRGLILNQSRPILKMRVFAF